MKQSSMTAWFATTKKSTMRSLNTVEHCAPLTLHWKQAKTHTQTRAQSKKTANTRNKKTLSNQTSIKEDSHCWLWNCARMQFVVCKVAKQFLRRSNTYRVHQGSRNSKRRACTGIQKTQESALDQQYSWPCQDRESNLWDRSYSLNHSSMATAIA